MKTFLQKCFSSNEHPIFWREEGLCWWICPHEFSCALPMFPSPFSLACMCVGTHTHTHTHHTSLELSSQEIRDIGFFFMCDAKQEQKLSAPIHKFCFTATRKHALSLSLSHMRTHTHPLPEMFWLFSTWSIGRYPPQESCSCCLHLPGNGNSGKAVFWKSHQSGQHEAWLQSPREKTSEPWWGWVGPHTVIPSAQLVTGCPDMLAWHLKNTLDEKSWRKMIVHGKEW